MAGLYLHIPFCTQRCVYCDFYFTTTRSDHASFVDSLCTELERYARTESPAPLDTIYLGGGTPSLLELDELERIFETIHAHFPADEVRETTLELNPENADPAYLRGLRALGVDRLSIGIQSFFADDLAFMNRSHTAEEAKAIVPMARQAGFENLSVDLIFGLPDQPEAHWQTNLERVAQMEVPHLSTYGLTIEPRTPLANQIERGLVEPASDDTMHARYQFTMDFLRRHGYEHYELSSFARPGRRSQHNQLYWQHVDYLGVGPSAHSFLWQDADEAHRWENVRNLRQYEAQMDDGELPVADRSALSGPALADEFVMLRLRTADGLDLDHLQSRYGYDLRNEKSETLQWLKAEQYIEETPGEMLRLTDAGKQVCDAVTTKLLPSS